MVLVVAVMVLKHMVEVALALVHTLFFQRLLEVVFLVFHELVQ
jgi:hypothetical protein